MGNLPFYERGLKFKCQRCSACCRYDEGFVYLSENDIEKLSAYLKMDKKQFIGVYCRFVNQNRENKPPLSLKEKSNKDCIFWDNALKSPQAAAQSGGCIVYECRPLQCRLFPFWENILASSKTWEMASTGCPGINRGKHYTKEEIDTFLEMRLNEQVITNN